MSDIPWLWVVRRKAPPQPWTDERRVNALFHVPKVHLPAEFMGTVYATCRADALTLANALNEEPKATVDVIAEAAWNTLTGMERSVFLGTFEPPVEPRQAPQVRPKGGICRTCGCAIPRKRRTGRMRTYCDACVPPELQRSRKYQAALTGRCGNVNKSCG